jgi:hypothetical protein
LVIAAQQDRLWVGGGRGAGTCPPPPQSGLVGAAGLQTGGGWVQLRHNCCSLHLLMFLLVCTVCTHLLWVCVNGGGAWCPDAASVSLAQQLLQPSRSLVAVLAREAVASCFVVALDVLGTAGVRTQQAMFLVARGSPPRTAPVTPAALPGHAFRGVHADLGQPSRSQDNGHTRWRCTATTCMRMHVRGNAVQAGGRSQKRLTTQAAPSPR